MRELVLLANSVMSNSEQDIYPFKFIFIEFGFLSFLTIYVLSPMKKINLSCSLISSC